MSFSNNAAQMKKSRILVVDDEECVADTMKEYLIAEGFDATGIVFVLRSISSTSIFFPVFATFGLGANFAGS